jgi:hypothetical protein
MLDQLLPGQGIGGGEADGGEVGVHVLALLEDVGAADLDAAIPVLGVRLATDGVRLYSYH